MSRTLCTLLIAALAGAPAAIAQPAGADDGWRPLFDGRTTEGWAMVGPGEFRVVDGVLETRGGMGLFWYTRERFGDAQLRVVFQTSRPKDNSGVFIRIPDPPASPWDAVHKGYEVQIYDAGDAWHRTGVLYSITEAREMVSPALGEWTTMLITLDGPRTRVEVNGKLVTDFTEGQEVPPKKSKWDPERGPRPLSGYIGLQNHDDDTRVRFREVSVRALQ